MNHIEHLKSAGLLNGQTVVDVGAGDGVYSQLLSAEGASVTAVEIDPVKVAKAKSQLPTDIDVKLGAAERLPLENKSQDLVCFFFSLHHVPAGVQDAAFDEVHRVVRPGGRLHVVEPYPFGTMFDVVRMVEDETLVRTNSHKVLGQLHRDRRFNFLSKKEYVLTREYPTFEFFLDKIVRPDLDRSAAFERVAEEMEKTYNRVVEEVDGVRVLRQPCAAYHFSVTA